MPTRSAEADMPDRPDPASGTPILRVKDITKSFGGMMVLNGVSFDVKARQVTGLIGPNGAGKTTLFNLIAGVYGPDAGSIALHGRSVAHLSPSARVARGISRTFQEIRLFPSLTAIENVMVGCLDDPGLATVVCLGKRSAAHERRMMARAKEMLQLVGLPDLADRYPRQMSYGQQKRVGIARALATGQNLLCLDEPAAGLDPTAAKDLASLIGRLSETVGTILVIEHNLELVRDVCSQVLFLDCGTIAVEGTPDQVMHDERVWRAFMGV